MIVKDVGSFLCWLTHIKEEYLIRSSRSVSGGHVIYHAVGRLRFQICEISLSDRHLTRFGT